MVAGPASTGTAASTRSIRGRALRCGRSCAASSATPPTGWWRAPSGDRAPERSLPARGSLSRSRGSGDMGMGARRLLVVLVGAAVVLAGCRVPGEWFPGHGKAEPSGVHVVAPANKTQAPASGEVPLDVRVASNLDPATLR